ncbi:MBL fold metallo-hydrolase [Cellulomonas fimi]|uniref:MBL fold metallo-hydrolase n=1 Tax=Cellulomonas fimi TaxID=1708 RepID=A0A7Y0LWJ6_CELFI|nr:MBL fold metallo-hydrolase [Cellulomonas fimi]NMR19526.1 MBL fold metallo-hydrolase [Cellulomonas fimi]
MSDPIGSDGQGAPGPVPPPRSLTVTWLGHSTAVLDVDGVRIVTDPLLKRHAGLLRRRGGRPDPATWQGADAVLLSHLHHDHAELSSLRLLGPVPVVTAPSSAHWLRNRGLRGVGLHRSTWVGLGPRVGADDEGTGATGAGGTAEAGAEGAGAADDEGAPRRHDDDGPGDHGGAGEPGRDHEVGRASVRVRLCPAVHGHRPMPHRPNAAVGHLVRGSGVCVWVAGDTSLYPEMSRLPVLAGASVDVALVPVHGWGPRLSGGHLGPVDAARACAAAGARFAVPVHWGTLHAPASRRLPPGWMDRAGEAFAAALTRLAPACRAVVLQPGESWTLPEGGAGRG